MLLAERQIRALIADLILEGFKDDQRYLSEKYPDKAQQISALEPRWISWLMSRFGASPTHTEIHPFEEAFTALIEFVEKFQAIASKWKTNEKFRQSVDTFLPDRAWKGKDVTPAIISSLTVDEMVTLKGLAEREKQTVEVDQAVDIEGDRVGKVGPWNLWIPTTMEKSCKIAGYDPVTRVPKTTWCTARTAGSNLFYHYVGSQDADIVLFYVIRDDPAADEDWLSVGYQNGKPVLKGERGGLSVKRDNSGLTAQALQKILGGDYDPIMGMLDERAKSMAGVHPAKEEVRAAAKDPVLFKKMMKGHSKEENDSMKQMIIGVPDIAPEVINLLAADPDRDLSYRIATHKRSPPEALDKIVDKALKTHDHRVAMTAAENPTTRPETLRMLAGALPANYMGAIAQNPNTPVDVLLDMSRGNNIYAFNTLVFNPSLTAEIIENILNYKIITKISSRHVLLNNPNITTAQVVKIFNMGGPATEYALKHPKLPMDILLDSLDAPITFNSRIAYLNPNVPPEMLVRIMDDPTHKSWQAELLQNPSMPAHILRRWVEFEKKDTGFMFYVLNNPNLPEDLMMKIAKKAPVDDRMTLVRHPGVTDAVLQVLAKDRAASVRKFTKYVIRDRAAAAMNEALSRVIRRLLR